jgi:tetratricopeptide (TPR) repeat protein
LSLLSEAQGLAARGDINEALRLLRKGLSIAKVGRDKKSQSLIHSEMGLCYQEKNRTREALREFERACRATPQSSTCLLMLGTCYLDEGDLENAGKYLSQALALAEKEHRKGLYAKDPSNLLNACILLSKASRNLAAKSLQFGLKKFPNHPILKQELQDLTG